MESSVVDITPSEPNRLAIDAFGKIVGPPGFYTKVGGVFFYQEQSFQIS